QLYAAAVERIFDDVLCLERQYAHTAEHVVVQPLVREQVEREKRFAGCDLCIALCLCNRSIGKVLFGKLAVEVAAEPLFVAAVVQEPAVCKTGADIDLRQER